MALEESFASCLKTPFAVILTEHGYSRERNYHLVVPIIRGDGFVAEAGVLRVEGREWLRIFSEPPESVLLPVQVIQSAWYEYDFVAETPFVVDEDTLERIDKFLVTLFGLTDG